MRFVTPAIAVLCVAMLCIAPASAKPSAEQRAAAQTFVEAVWQAEPYVMAAVQTRDVGELRKQAESLRLTQMRRSDTAPDGLGEKLNACSRATYELGNIAGYLAMTLELGMTAEYLVNLKEIDKRWSTEIRACEAALGSRRPRQFKLGLN